MKIFNRKKAIEYLPDAKNKKVSVVWRLNVWFVLIVILSISVVGLMSFRMISNSILNNTKLSSAQLINQTSKNIEIIMSNLDELALSVSRDSVLTECVMELNITKDEHKKANDIRKIESVLNRYFVTRNDIADIAVVSNSLEYITTGQQRPDVRKNISYFYPVRQFKKSGKKSLWLDTYRSDVDTTLFSAGGYGQVFSIIKSIHSSNSLNSHGMLVLNVKESYLFSLISDIKPSDNGKIYIINKDGNYVMNPYNRFLNGTVSQVDYFFYLKDVIKFEKGSMIKKVEGKDFLITYDTVKEINGTELGWKIVTVTPVSSITAGITDAGKNLFFLGLGCVAFGFIFSFLLVRIYDFFVDKKYTERHSIIMEQERLASLGQLIGGIAHNFRTPIMSIAGGLEALKDLAVEYDSSIEDTDVTEEDHHEIAKEMSEWVQKVKPYCSYMSDIISTVKGQAVNCNESSIESFSIDDLIKRVTILMNHELKRFQCEMRMNLEVDSQTEIRGELNNLVQVMNNLISNSIESYDSKGGKIDVLFSNKGNNLEIVVKDYGCGIPEKVKNKLLKEMITTKGQSGTGLGLYMSYSTIKGKFGGIMSIKSEVGKGTAISAIIPLLNK